MKKQSQKQKNRNNKIARKSQIRAQKRKNVAQSRATAYRKYLNKLRRGDFQLPAENFTPVDVLTTETDVDISDEVKQIQDDTKISL